MQPNGPLQLSTNAKVDQSSFGRSLVVIRLIWRETWILKRGRRKRGASKATPIRVSCWRELNPSAFCAGLKFALLGCIDNYELACFISCSGANTIALEAKTSRDIKYKMTLQLGSRKSRLFCPLNRMCRNSSNNLDAISLKLLGIVIAIASSWLSCVRSWIQLARATALHRADHPTFAASKSQHSKF